MSDQELSDQELVDLLEDNSVNLTINLGDLWSFEFRHPLYRPIKFGLSALDDDNALRQAFQNYWNYHQDRITINVILNGSTTTITRSTKCTYNTVLSCIAGAAARGGEEFKEVCSAFLQAMQDRDIDLTLHYGSSSTSSTSSASQGGKKRKPVKRKAAAPKAPKRRPATAPSRATKCGTCKKAVPKRSAGAACCSKTVAAKKAKTRRPAKK